MVTRNFKPHSCALNENGPESIHRAVETAHLFSLANALQASQATRLAILIEEAVTNLYDHGCVDNSFRGQLDLVGAPGDVRITLRDSGASFDLRTADAPNRPNMERGGGVGLAMIRAWADITSYRSEAGMNVLTLKLRR